jgi:hypothetical protein
VSGWRFLDVPLFFISQSAVDSGSCDVVSNQQDFWVPLDHTIEIRRNFWHVVPSRARFTALALLTKVTVLPLDTCSRSRVSAIKMNGSDGGRESRGPGPIYTLAAHPWLVHTSFTPRALSLLSASIRAPRSPTSRRPEFFAAGDFSTRTVHLRIEHIP